MKLKSVEERGWREMMKCIFDLTLSSAGLFIGHCAHTAHAVGAPIIFTKTHPGLTGKPFRMVKFRFFNFFNYIGQ